MSPAPARRLVTAVGRRVPLRVRRALRRTAALPRAHSSVRAACGLPAGVPLMVYTGRIVDDRGIAAVVDALPRLPKFHLALVCPGADRVVVRALLRQAESVGVAHRVHAVTRPRRMAPDFLASADLAVLGFERGGPETPLVPAALDEYRAAGLTIVAGNARAVREYLTRHDAGEVFAPGSPRNFVNAVQRAQKRTSAAPGAAPAARVAAEPEAPAVPWPPLGAGPVRLGLGTANFAGVLTAFTRAISAARPDVSAELVVAKPPAAFPHPADVYIHFPHEHRLDVQLEQIRRVLGGYTHLIVDAFRPILGRLNGDDISADLPALRRAGIKLALLAHGSEIRHPGRHLERHAESGFRDAPEELVARLTEVTEKNRRTAEESGLPLFVTTPDLLDDVPWATWAPLVLDVDAWACDRPILERTRPLVLHAPSTRWTKGTDRILSDLQDLHDRKIIEFRLIEGLPWSEMQALVKDADVVIDQLVMGSYCTFACEGMAAGKAVISYLDEDVHRRVDVRPPIVSATPSTVVKAIETLLDDRAAGARLGAEGVAYVREHHDGRRTAAVFDEFLR
ncbi:Glycosyl transferases group 1 [Micromonospora pattaloongensis]|uniref:Glycosyl transferases group 1 n=1 Tax=Micromonospora pattaloongensis TaxID=405436 RepID=A0A1H3SIW2_9ACTN|nr:glycosyltransferase [Micromonospora pattaloongensis]SDZ38003.1 Glycosyl transferases group 1 [Micromonospora pattaloongensis]